MKRTEAGLHRSALMLAFLTAFLASGCATLGKSTEEVVIERANERWELMLAGDLPQAYQYLSPGYRSGIGSLDWQRKILQQRIRWNSGEAVSAQCDEDACKVTVTIGYTAFGAIPGMMKFDGKSSVFEDWVKTNGVWYYLPRN